MRCIICPRYEQDFMQWDTISEILPSELLVLLNYLKRKKQNREYIRYSTDSFVLEVPVDDYPLF